MTTLREKIEAAINASANDAGKAAIDVCKLLDEEIGLQGNGWFDDDAVMLSALKSD
jgi:hypothetical protein